MTNSPWREQFFTTGWWTHSSGALIKELQNKHLQ